MTQIETPRLLLRPLSLVDATQYHQAIWSDPDVTRFLPGSVPRPLDQVEATILRFAAHWQAHQFGIWAVEDKTSSTVIGHCGMQYLPNTTVVELAYALGKLFWRKGLATEAAGATLQFGFDQLHLAEIVALAVPENVASRRVMEKLGMRHEKMTTDFYNTELAYYVMPSE